MVSEARPTQVLKKRKGNQAMYARNGIILSCKYVGRCTYSTHSRRSDLHTCMDRNGDTR